MAETMKRGGVRVALWLVGGTLAYNVVEAVIALATGTRAESIALVGFGLDSVIECAASALLLWRLAVESRGADHAEVEAHERKVRRFVGITFLALALYVLAESGWGLHTRARAAESPLGIGLAIASLVVMPVLSFFKLREAARIGSRALRAEAKETLACAYLSAALLLGLAANAAAGWWWADPVAALLMVPWLIKEGIEGLRGDECCG